MVGMGPRDRSGGQRRSTGKRWAAQAFGVAIFSLLSFMLLFQMRQDRMAALTTATATADRLARVLEAHTRETVSSVGAVLSTTALHLGMMNDAAALQPERVRAVLSANVRSLPYLKAITFIGADALVVASTHPRVADNIDASSRDYFHKHAAGERGTLIGIATPSLTTPHLIVPITQRVETAGGDFAGVLVAVIDFRYFEAFFKTLSVGERGLVALYSGDNAMIPETPFNEARIDSAVRTDRLFGADALASAVGGTFRAETPLDGIDRIVGIRDVDGLFLGVMVGLSVDEVLAGWRDGTRSHAIVWLAAGCGVVGLTILLLGQMHRRDRVTEALRAAGERLCRNEQHLTRAQNVSRMGSWELDPISGQLIWSPMMYRIFGQPKSFRPTIGGLFDIVGPKARDGLQAVLDRAISGVVPSALEFDVTRPDGQTRRCRCKCEPVISTGNKTVAIVGTLQDVTEQRRAEAERLDLERQLQQALKMEALGTLAGGIAHDLNNALVPVLGLTECVMESLPAGGAERADLELVIDGATRARDLVRQILAFSRKEAPEREPVDIAKVVDIGWELLLRALPFGVRMERRCAAGALVLADHSQIDQVIVNLVTNAVQAIGVGPGTVTVSVTAQRDTAPGTARLTVEDTGPGMDETTRSRVFEPFFTTKPVGEGTGLGLAVVHGIVTSHGGSIECRNRLGGGTVFDVFLPLFETAVAEPIPCDFI
jgi:signal transduction histidine kinase